jgi:hypothetical protein
VISASPWLFMLGLPDGATRLVDPRPSTLYGADADGPVGEPLVRVDFATTSGGETGHSWAPLE